MSKIYSLCYFLWYDVAELQNFFIICNVIRRWMDRVTKVYIL